MEFKATAVLMAVALTAAGGAAAAQSPKATPARKAAIEKIVGNHRHFVQPRTMAEAARTEARAPDGTVSVAVPEELWNNLSVSKDGSGQLRMHESDGAAPVAPATTEAPANE
jgi:ABC-type phosphate transport system substrate-binding protein